MTFVCSGKCDDNDLIIASRSGRGGRGGKKLYIVNTAYCSICDIWINTYNITNRCFCCGVRLRFNTHNNASKKKKLENIVRY